MLKFLLHFCFILSFELLFFKILLSTYSNDLVLSRLIFEDSCQTIKINILTCPYQLSRFPPLWSLAFFYKCYAVVSGRSMNNLWIIWVAIFFPYESFVFLYLFPMNISNTISLSWNVQGTNIQHQILLRDGRLLFVPITFRVCCLVIVIFWAWKQLFLCLMDMKKESTFHLALIMKVISTTCLMGPCQTHSQYNIQRIVFMFLTVRK